MHERRFVFGSGRSSKGCRRWALGNGLSSFLATIVEPVGASAVPGLFHRRSTAFQPGKQFFGAVCS